MAKIGEKFVENAIDLGRRELGGLLYEGSNIAQPMYPIRGGYEVNRETSAPKEVPTLADRLQEPVVDEIEPDRDERDLGIERE